MLDIKLSPVSQNFIKNTKTNKVQIQDTKTNEPKKDSFAKNYKKEATFLGILGGGVLVFGMGFLAYKGKLGKKAQETFQGFVSKIKTKTIAEDIKQPEIIEPQKTNPIEQKIIVKADSTTIPLLEDNKKIEPKTKLEIEPKVELKTSPEVELMEQKATTEAIKVENEPLCKETIVELDLSKENIPTIEVVEPQTMPEMTSETVVEFEQPKKEDILIAEISENPETKTHSAIELTPIEKEKSTNKLAEIMKDINIVRL